MAGVDGRISVAAKQSGYASTNQTVLISVIPTSASPQEPTLFGIPAWIRLAAAIIALVKTIAAQHDWPAIVTR